MHLSQVFVKAEFYLSKRLELRNYVRLQNVNCYMKHSNEEFLCLEKYYIASESSTMFYGFELGTKKGLNLLFF